MSENSTGARALLTQPLLYETFSALAGGKRAREAFIGEHVRLRGRTGSWTSGAALGRFEPTCLQASAMWVSISARPTFTALGSTSETQPSFASATRPGWMTTCANSTTSSRWASCTTSTILWHWSSFAARRARCGQEGASCQSTRRTRAHPQSLLARAVIARDRGQHVRSAEYTSLARSVFSQVTPFQREDLLRIPYTHCVLECQGPPQNQ